MSKVRRKEIICLVVLVCVLIGSAVFMRVRKDDLSSEGASALGAFDSGVSDENVVNVDPIPVAAETISASVASENLKTYTHPNPKFSVDFPAGMSVKTYDEGGESQTVLFKGPEGSFQVFISPYDGDDSLSAEDIQRLQPFTQVVEPQTIQLHGVQAMLFWSAVPEIGKTREVWFAKGGKLFSVTTHADRDTWLAHIMTSWRFE